MNKAKLIGYTIGPIGSGILGFISLPIITWFYSVEDVGRISMLQVFTSFSILFFCLGLDQAYVREYHEVDNKGSLLVTVVLPGLVLCLIILTMIFIYDSELISNWLYGIKSSYLSIITVLCCIITLISRFLSLILRMQEKSLAFSMSQLLPKILLLGFIFSVIFLGYRKDAYSLLTANTLALVFSLLIYAWNTKNDWFPALKEEINKQKFIEYITFGMPLVVGGVASWGLNSADKLFLRTMASYTELGIYSVAISVAGIASIISGIFNTIWAPLVYKWSSNDSIDYHKLDEVSNYVLAVIYFIIVLSGLFSWVLVYFLPSKYNEVQVLVTICLIGPLFYTLSETTAVGIAIVRRTKFSMYASIGAMLTCVVSNMTLVPKLGSSGAAISLALSFWIFYFLRTEFSARIWRKMPTTKFYLVSFVLLIVAIVNVFIPINSLYRYVLWIIMFLFGIYIFRNLGLLNFRNLRKTG